MLLNKDFRKIEQSDNKIYINTEKMSFENRKSYYYNQYL